jgi:hypothetical protein
MQFIPRPVAMTTPVQTTNDAVDDAPATGGAVLNAAPAVLGVVVFLIGVALLGYVFVAANGLFNAPPPQVPSAPPPATAAAAGAAGTASPAGTAALAIGQQFSALVQKLLVLLVMCVAGSVVASKGVQMAFAARNAAVNARHSEDAPAPASPPPTPSPRAATNGHAAPSPAPPAADESPTLVPKSPPRQ